MFDKEKLNNYLAAGKENEKSFLKCLEGCYEDISSVESTKEQDMKEHWDLKIMQEFTVDVKAIKKISRSGEYDENSHWVEIKGVNNSKGWLYGGKADYISFETIDYWLVVNREKLKQFISEKCKDKIKALNTKDALYKLYTRDGRNDVITRVKTIDLIYIADKMLKK